MKRFDATYINDKGKSIFLCPLDITECGWSGLFEGLEGCPECRLDDCKISGVIVLQQGDIDPCEENANLRHLLQRCKPLLMRPLDPDGFGMKREVLRDIEQHFLRYPKEVNL